jgi:hypothetical protein
MSELQGSGTEITGADPAQTARIRRFIAMAQGIVPHLPSREAELEALARANEPHGLRPPASEFVVGLFMTPMSASGIYVGSRTEEMKHATKTTPEWGGEDQNGGS